MMNGSIPSPLPSALRALFVDGNQMTGDVPQLPATLTNLGLGYIGYSGNHFTGSVVLNRPVEVFINNNWITDVVVYDTSQLSYCDLSNNALLGNPDIANLTMCTQNSLYSANLLPITISSKTTQAATNPISNIPSSATTGIPSYVAATTAHGNDGIHN